MKTMRINKLVVGLAVLALSIQAMAQETTVFPKGELSPDGVHHIGKVWLSELSGPDSTFTFSVAQAIFAPGARLDWHSHPGGQILMITEGVGYYQEKGKPKQTVRKGEVIKCPPGIEHWHGATPTSGFGYLATSPSQKGKTIWFKRVTDDEYGPAK